MPARSRIPNQQQAKLLARIWSAEDDPEICPVDDAEWIPPALRAALRRGWCRRNGVPACVRTTTRWEYLELTASGFLALERYLTQQRYQRRPA